MKAATPARVGIGHDIHRLEPGRPLVLGGVTIAAERGFATPSDGDVLCHALIDAVAGALAEGDMGAFFPADDHPDAEGAVSIEYVQTMKDHIADHGLEVAHVDSYITLGTTRLAAHLAAMRREVSKALDIPLERISVKARTNDGLGAEGEGLAASATTIVLLQPLASGVSE